jgi:hypothetical protein
MAPKAGAPLKNDVAILRDMSDSAWNNLVADLYDRRRGATVQIPLLFDDIV